MALSAARADELRKLGIINAAQLTPQAEALIKGLTDAEFQALLSVRAKIPVASQAAYDNTIRTMGF
jgi:hypothetical protein